MGLFKGRGRKCVGGEWQGKEVGRKWRRIGEGADGEIFLEFQTLIISFQNNTNYFFLVLFHLFEIFIFILLSVFCLSMIFYFTRWDRDCLKWARLWACLGLGNFFCGDKYVELKTLLRFYEYSGL